MITDKKLIIDTVAQLQKTRMITDFFADNVKNYQF